MSKAGTFATFETSGGAAIFRIPLQVFPRFWAYAYIVQFENETYLIDTGSGTDTSHEDLLNGFQKAGLQPSDLTYILLTHAHIDHYGGLTRLKSITNAKIGCHELDLQTVAHHDARLALIGHRLASFLTEAGLDHETRDTLLGIYRFTKALYRSVPVDFTYEEAGMKVAALEMIHLPGHCPGHVAMRLDDVVFCGDILVKGVTPHLAPETINPNGGLDHYLESLSAFQEWSRGAALILNGHDDPIADVAASVDATHQNIIRRVSYALQAMNESLTTMEICKAIYGESGGYNQLLMIEKTGAYIEYLYEHGMVEIVNAEEVEQGRPAKYKRLRDFANDEIIPKQKVSVAG